MCLCVHAQGGGGGQSNKPRPHHTYLGGEVEPESPWSHERATLVSLTQHTPQGKVQGMGPRVVLHHSTPTILQHNGSF